MEEENTKTLEALGNEALDRIKESQPPLWLGAPPDLGKCARTASKYLFSLIFPHTPTCPLSSLLVENFDAEQIWQQIDLQAQPLISSLKNRVRKLQKSSQTLRLLDGGDEPPFEDFKGNVSGGEKVEADANEDWENDDPDAELDEKEFSEDEGSQEQEEEAEEEDGKYDGVEDRFLKINDLEKFLNEAEEQGLEPPKDKTEDAETSTEEEEEDSDADEIGDDLEEVGGHDKTVKHPKYQDFFGGKTKTKIKKQAASRSQPKEMHFDDEDVSDEEPEDVSDEEPEDVSDEDPDEKQPTGKLSTHERQMEKIRKRMEQLEKANLETKSWTMQGEVTASKRPKNSALEVDLDFDHNMRPAPVITEEVTASLEDIIKRRIAEEQFDDVQRKPALPSTAPKERIELDEEKSKKGLAELYEAEYMQSMGITAAPVSASDALKKEADLLFRKLCLKLDAMSHFHFTPKPVIEDMSIRANVPALAMEEVAPLAVSDASMLAPEEVFAGKGAVKGEGELTQEERKRRRAKKKRKYKAGKASKEIAKKARIQAEGDDEERGNWNSREKDQQHAQTHYGKSSKVFYELDQAKDKGGVRSSQKKTDVLHPSFLKL